MSAYLVLAHTLLIKIFDLSACTTLNRELEKEDKRKGEQAHLIALLVRNIT